jgi:hypothetical protein
LTLSEFVRLGVAEGVALHLSKTHCLGGPPRRRSDVLGRWPEGISA